MAFIDDTMLTIHILAVFAALSSFVITSLISYLAGKEPQNETDLYKVNTIISKIGLSAIILLIITGEYMAPSFRPSTWVIIKETVWLIIVLLVFFLLRPRMKATVAAINNEAPIEDIRSNYKKAKIVVHIITGFVLLNIIIAVYKPF